MADNFHCVIIKKAFQWAPSDIKILTCLALLMLPPISLSECSVWKALGYTGLQILKD